MWKVKWGRRRQPGLLDRMARVVPRERESGVKATITEYVVSQQGALVSRDVAQKQINMVVQALSRMKT